MSGSTSMATSSAHFTNIPIPLMLAKMRFLLSRGTCKRGPMLLLRTQLNFLLTLLRLRVPAKLKLIRQRIQQQILVLLTLFLIQKVKLLLKKTLRRLPQRQLLKEMKAKLHHRILQTLQIVLRRLQQRLKILLLLLRMIP
mmetsp:Transcript_31696/g.48539  ORF Transcript_31696/g.48539 Transcript_31696/m.48539 type:complete len:140 (-) Transcript_31696:2951-3370(-)